MNIKQFKQRTGIFNDLKVRVNKDPKWCNAWDNSQSSLKCVNIPKDVYDAIARDPNTQLRVHNQEVKTFENKEGETIEYMSYTLLEDKPMESDKDVIGTL